MNLGEHGVKMDENGMKRVLNGSRGHLSPPREAPAAPQLLDPTGGTPRTSPREQSGRRGAAVGKGQALSASKTAASEPIWALARRFRGAFRPFLGPNSSQRPALRLKTSLKSGRSRRRS